MHLQLTQLRGNHPGVGFKRLGECGGTGFTVGALEQGKAQLGFKVADGHAHR
ncbi:hypothetical protein D3C78_1879290 [compost metagenome]